MPFDQIMEAVEAGEARYGLLIHEGQLTHERHGLRSIVNLGTWWFEQTGLPLPLGVNTIKRSLPDDVKKRASRELKASIEYGLRIEKKPWPGRCVTRAAWRPRRPTRSSACTSIGARSIWAKTAAPASGCS